MNFGCIANTDDANGPIVNVMDKAFIRHMSRKKPKSGGKKRSNRRKHVKHNKMTRKGSRMHNALKSITHNICYNWVNIIDEFLSLC